MRLFYTISSVFLSVALFLSCQNTPSSQHTDTANTTDPTEASVTPDPATSPEEQTLTAKFVEFSLGDASHFVFVDEAGKMWDFGGNEDANYAFAMELDEDQVDDTNQGWGSDPDLQGKWFDLRYVYRSQPLYIDGPVASVPIILEARLRE